WSPESAFHDAHEPRRGCNGGRGIPSSISRWNRAVSGPKSRVGTRRQRGSLRCQLNEIVVLALLSPPLQVSAHPVIAVFNGPAGRGRALPREGLFGLVERTGHGMAAPVQIVDDGIALDVSQPLAIALGCLIGPLLG